MSYTLVLEWMPGDLYMSAVTARCTAPTSSYSVVWLPPNKVYQITLYCGSTSLVSFLVGAFRGKAWSYMRQCDNGHFYDESRFDSCPYCQEGAGVGKTVAAGTVGKTVAAVPGGAAPEADRGKTVGIIKKKIGIDPAVGFLVCVSGPHRGADYKLVAGRNFIGRAAAMDVALADDDTVSRESHALVTYDAKHNSFSLSPGQGRGITYCNDEQVEMVRPLKAYDVIEVGKSQLLFLPLCGEQFQWNEE